METPRKQPIKPALPDPDPQPTLHSFFAGPSHRPPPPPASAKRVLGASRLGPQSASKPKLKPKQKSTPIKRQKGKAKPAAAAVPPKLLEAVELSSGSEGEPEGKRRRVDKGKGKAVEQDVKVELVIISSPVCSPTRPSSPDARVEKERARSPDVAPAPLPVKALSPPPGLVELLSSTAAPLQEDSETPHGSECGDESQPAWLNEDADADDSQALVPPPCLTEEEGQPSLLDEEVMAKEELFKYMVVGSSKDLEQAEAVVKDEDTGCPVCGDALAGLTTKVREPLRTGLGLAADYSGWLQNRQLHVNSCLDGTTRSKPSVLSSFLPKFSSLFRPTPPAPDTKPGGELKPKLVPPPVRQGKGLNAFAALMAQSVTQKLWAEVDAIEGDAVREANKGKRRERGAERKVPFYKWVEGMEITFVFLLSVRGARARRADDRVAQG